ncbi:MAG: hypothetical protein Q9166_002704 [cf. Caloplaca sp. 2 TL-2023]
MNLSSEPRNVVEITDSSDDDRDLRLEDFMTAEELQAAVHRSLLPLNRTPEPPDLTGNDAWNPQLAGNVRTAVVAPYDQCLQKVLDIFPDISHDHIKSLYDSHPSKAISPDGVPLSEEIISQILDGGTYPKERDRQNELKRKRSEVENSDDERAVKWRNEWINADRVPRGVLDRVYSQHALRMLQEDYPDIPRTFLERKLSESGHLYATYLAVDLVENTYDSGAPRAYTKLKKSRKPNTAKPVTMTAVGFSLTELQKELEAARVQRKKLQTQRQIKRDASAAEAAEEKALRDSNQVMECGCCFDDDVPINKVTFCNADNPHSFCFQCALTHANTQIGLARYELTCMHGDGCPATFSHLERNRFLDPRTIEKLDRLQQQTELRKANLSNLESCPFCDFAAECPPIETDKEFRCENPECQKVSCRKCRLVTHIPLSCEEFKKDNSLSERHQVEEARTQALIRKCPKCKKTVMKESGCNKVTCECGGRLCDYCGKEITNDGYSHFRDGPTSINIPGLKGKCPTYDDAYSRNQQNMDKAEKEAREKIRKENPDISEEDLKIKMDAKVSSPPREVGYARGMGGFMAPPPEYYQAHLMAHRRPRAYQGNFEQMQAPGVAGRRGAIYPGYPHAMHGAPGGVPHANVYAGQFAAPQNLPALPIRQDQPAYDDIFGGGGQAYNGARDHGPGAQRVHAGGYGYQEPAHFGNGENPANQYDFDWGVDVMDDIMGDMPNGLDDWEAYPQRGRRRRH